MRNKINVIVCVLVVVCVALFAAACAPKDADGLIKLSTPSNLALNGSVLSWDEVKNAKEYFISVDGKELEQSVTNTTCDLSNLITGYGNFSVAVRAYGDGKKYGTSDKSSAIVYHKGETLDTPVVTIKDKVASWNSVENAANYSVKVTDSKGKTLDETTVESTQTLSYNFADKKAPTDNASGEAQEKELYGEYGAYRISVIANPAADNVKYSQSLAGTATYYNATVLAVPKFTDMTGTTIRWESVANASNYTLRKTYQDGNFEDAEVSGTSYAYRTKFNLEKVGEYTFTVRANGDNQVYYTSEFCEKNDEYKVNKLAAVQSEDINLTYDGSQAKLSWKIAADSLATEFTLNLNATLPDGSVELEGSILQQTISNKLKLVVADVYDFYKYSEDKTTIEKAAGTILLYNMNGFAKVRYNNEDYFLKDKENKDVKWADFKPSASVDVICDMSDGIKFVNERKEYADPSNGAILSQNTGDKQDVLGSDGNQLFYFEEVDGETKLDVVKGVEYEGNEIKYHTFELVIDDIFIKVNKDENDTTYEYPISDDKYYGILYDVSVAADNDSKNYIVSQGATALGQYMSYKIPQKVDGKYEINNAGEYAYIAINSFVNPNNTDEFVVKNNINFNGYELVQIDTFSGVINGEKHTVSGIVVGNKVMTASGVIAKEGADLEYSMFVNIDDKGDETKGIIQNIFFVGVGFVGYDKDELDESVKSIKVAPLAINNKGSVNDVLVQSDAIKAEGANVAGLVVNNYKYINKVSVYAELEGATVGGVVINNEAGTVVVYTGFYGKVTATLSDVLAQGVTSVAGAGFVVNNSGYISGSFAIGDVNVSATGLDGIYAGGFVARNSGDISQSYSGEFTLNNVFTAVTANGDNAYAGGFVGHNNGDITSSYSTNKATASMYAGGFVGYNESNITSCYSTGGTARTGANRGTFVGKNVGENNVVKSVGYSTDSWAADEVVEVLTSSEKLDDIIGILYGDGDADMALMRDNGYRNPLIKELIYTKDNIVTMRPSQTVADQGIVFNKNKNEVQDTQATMCGDNTKKGNRIVIELSGERVVSRYIYGYVS